MNDICREPNEPTEQTLRFRYRPNVNLIRYRTDTVTIAQSTPAYGARVPPSGLTSSKTIRNVETLLRKTIRSAEWRVKQFLQYADKFQVSLTLEGLRVAQTEEGISMKLDQVCAEQLGPDQPSRVFSAKYYTKDDEPLFFYLGQRWTDRQPCVRVLLNPL